MKRRISDGLRWAYQSWATRSLAVGGAATVLDTIVLIICVKGFRLPSYVGAMIGVTFGSTLTFFANRAFTFKAQRFAIGPQALRFALATAGGMVAHAGCVWLFKERLGVPLVPAKLISDVCVFSVGQMLVLRYLVFPPKSHEAAERGARFRPAGRSQRARLRPGRSSR